MVTNASGDSWKGENHTVVTALLQDFTTRGLTVADGLLVVIDGAKAVRAVWDD